VDVHRDGSISALELEAGFSDCIVGRRPPGLRSQQWPAHSEPLATYLARAAELEAASIYAFERLAAELTRLGAPSHTVHAAQRAAHDEARHARMTARLARRFGFHGDTRPCIQATGERTPLAIALENAVEGCVRETFGALIAQHQAALARDPLIANSMRSIAVDETRHAELAWQVAGWLEPRLSVADRSVLARAREAALRQLAQEIASDTLPASTREHLGLPEASVQHALLERMAGSLALA
jgi:rubrerythrin